MKRMRRGLVRIWWAPTVANAALPTRAELNAGLDLTLYAFSAPGWKVEQQRVRIPSVVSNTVVERAGSSRFVESSVEFYELFHPEAKIVRNTLVAGTDGNIVRMPYGDAGMGAAIERCEVWPVRILTHLDTDWAADNEAASFIVPFAITSYPTLNAVVPAL